MCLKVSVNERKYIFLRVFFRKKQWRLIEISPTYFSNKETTVLLLHLIIRAKQFLEVPFKYLRKNSTKIIMSKQEKNQHDNLVAVEEQVLSSTEKFIENNKKTMSLVITVLVLVILAVLAFRNFYMIPQEKQAASEMYKAQAYFAVDSFQVALQGDDIDCVGFETIASEYTFTKSANLAKAYAGICSYKLGEYENAVEYLSSFSADDINVAPVALQLLGDAQVELGELKKAISSYRKVIDMKNSIFSPMSLKKAGIAYESLNDKETALEMYEEIKETYPQSSEAADIDKHIARLEVSNK